MSFSLKACSLLSIFCCAFLYARTNFTNDYIVLNTSGVTTPETYIAALDDANWEQFRLLDQKRQFKFENGFTFELKSAREILTLGYPVDLNKYSNHIPVNYQPPVLKLLAGNKIGMETHPVTIK